MKVNGQSLRVIRERSGWSPSRFAVKVQTTPGHLSNIEAGRRQASPELLARMAKVLDVPLMALISDVSPEEMAAG